MAYLLNLVYLALVAVLSPFLVWRAAKNGRYRRGLAAKLLGRVPVRAGSAPCIWFHAVSVGEINALGPVVAAFRLRLPSWQCVISTSTDAGFDLAVRKYSDLTVFFCPLDFSWATSTAMRRMRPDCLVLTELELWPNLIEAAQRSGARVAVINGRLSEHSFRGYRRLRPLVARLLGKIDFLAVQTAEYAQRFVALGAMPERVMVTGSVKFDNVQTDRNNPGTRRFREMAGVTTDDLVFMAGSTLEPEEQLALATYQELRVAHPRLRLVIVPRHPERFDAVGRLLDSSGLAWQRRSALDSRPADPQARILLVDTVGELGAWWGLAHVAFVGGSTGRRGGQNMIEPAAYGAAVSFGPDTRNFRDVTTRMLEAGAACVVQDGRQLTEFVRRCLAEPDHARTLGCRAHEIVAAGRGATERTVGHLAALLSADSHQRAAA